MTSHLHRVSDWVVGCYFHWMFDILFAIISVYSLIDFGLVVFVREAELLSHSVIHEVFHDIVVLLNRRLVTLHGFHP